MTRRVPLQESVILAPVVLGGCVYESVAIATGLVPTISAVTHRHPPLAVAVLAALAVHFRTPLAKLAGR